jgi:7-carboxy-7-deazaguanine synthase
MDGRLANVSELFVSPQGEGSHVGRRHLFVRFGGCPLRCRYCDSPESLTAVSACRVTWDDGRTEMVVNPLSAERLDALVAERARPEPQLHALALTGGEPLSQAGFLAEWLPNRSARAAKVLLETAATLPNQLERILPWVDIVSADIKLPSNSGEPAAWTEHATCLRMSAGRDLYVKVLVDDGTDPTEVAAAVRLVRSIDRDICVFLQPITDPATARLCITPETLERLYRQAAGLGVEVRVVPQIHKTLGVP